MINIGLLGPGKIAKRVVRGIMLADNANLYAVGSRDINRAKEFAKEYNALAYENEELLKDDNVDAVYITVPNVYHFKWVMKALNAGKHVICEKPMFINKDDCEEAFKLAKEKNLMLMEAMKSDFLPLTLKIKELLKSSEYGKLLYMDGKYSSVTSGEPGSWVFDAKTAGGLRDVGIYPISYCNFIADSKIKDTITICKEADDGLDLLGQTTILYDNGVLATCTSGLELKTINKIFIYTDKGYFEIEDFWKAGSGKFVTKDNIEEIKCEMFNDFMYEIKHFCDCVENGLNESPIASKEATMEILNVFDGRK